MIENLIALQDELRLCRREAQADYSSPCHIIANYKCHRPGIDAGLISPDPAELSAPVQILMVGINPKYGLPSCAPETERRPKLDSGKTFHRYQEHILSKAMEFLPSQSSVASVDLVPCGTPN